MDCVKVGKLIYELRKEKKLTQKQLADLMNISDRTISKWERGVGCPDVSLLNKLSEALNVNIEKILIGDLESNIANGGNMKKIKFYVCKTCGNTLYSTGDADISCCGRGLPPLEVKEDIMEHELEIESIEDEFYITIDHEMTKEHFISFVAYVNYDRVHFVKLFPEQLAELRISKIRKGDLYVYCSVHGLIKKGKIN